MANKKPPEDQDIIRIEPGSILSEGYGISPGKVMRDPSISLAAKGWYAYIMSYAGSGDRAWPSRERQKKELGIHPESIAKYRKEMEQAGLIKVDQERGKTGHFKRNVYTVLFVPAPPQSEPCRKFSDAVKIRRGYRKGQLKPCSVLTVSVKTDTINNNRSLINNRSRSKDLKMNRNSKAPNPSIKRLIDYYYNQFFEHFKEYPVIEGGRDGAIFGSLLKQLTEETIQILLDRYLGSNDSWIKQNGYNLPTFKIRINQMILDKKKAGVTDLDAWVMKKRGQQEGGQIINVNARTN
jgi:hypothetical protein